LVYSSCAKYIFLLPFLESEEAENILREVVSTASREVYGLTQQARHTVMFLLVVFDDTLFVADDNFIGRIGDLQCLDVLAKGFDMLCRKGTSEFLNISAKGLDFLLVLDITLMNLVPEFVYGRLRVLGSLDVVKELRLDFGTQVSQFMHNLLSKLLGLV
jgi:hypothetical protein